MSEANAAMARYIRAKSGFWGRMRYAFTTEKITELELDARRALTTLAAVIETRGVF